MRNNPFTVASEYKHKIGCIYLITDEKMEYVKIGLTSDNVEKRLSGMSTSNPHKLYCIATIPTKRINLQDEEQRLHKLFAHLRYRGEWFKFDYAIIDEYNRCNKEKNIPPLIETKTYIKEFFKECTQAAVTPEEYYEHWANILFGPTPIPEEQTYPTHYNKKKLCLSTKLHLKKYKGISVYDVIFKYKDKSYINWMLRNDVWKGPIDDKVRIAIN